MGGAQEVSLTADTFVYPSMGRCLRVKTSSAANWKLKLPLQGTRSVIRLRGTEVLVVLNESAQQVQIATNAGVNLSAVPAGDWALISYTGTNWMIHVG